MAAAGIVDSQSVKGADTVRSASRGYDAGKKGNGRKRHVVVDTLGLLLMVTVTAAACNTATAAPGWCCSRPWPAERGTRELRMLVANSSSAALWRTEAGTVTITTVPMTSRDSQIGRGAGRGSSRGHESH